MERLKGSEVARWKRRESGEVTKWEVSGFSKTWATQGESKISYFCF